MSPVDRQNGWHGVKQRTDVSPRSSAYLSSSGRRRADEWPVPSPLFGARHVWAPQNGPSMLLVDPGFEGC